MIAFHRCDQGGAGDDVIVIANFSAQAQHRYRIGFPNASNGKLRFNSDWDGYSSDFSIFLSQDVDAYAGAYDHCPNHRDLAIAPYAALSYSQS